MFECPICGCVYRIPKSACNVMFEEDGNRYKVNTILVCCPNNDGDTTIITGSHVYTGFESCGMLCDAKGTFIGERVE